MSSITVTADSGCSGAEVARDVAAALGHRHLGDEVFRMAAARSGLPEERLRRAMFQPASLFGMSEAQRRRYAAHVQATLLGHLLEDGLVFLGPAGHLFARGIAHVVRVHLTAALDYRAAELRRTEGIAPREARRRLEREDRQRLWWAQVVHGDQGPQPDTFDLVVAVDRLGADGAVSSIVAAAQEPRYRPTTYSLAYLRDVELQARVRAALIGVHPGVKVVQAKLGTVSLRVAAPPRAVARAASSLKELALRVEGVSEVDVEVVESLLD